MTSFDVGAIVISILGLSASITYYAIVLRNQNETRQPLFRNEVNICLCVDSELS